MSLLRGYGIARSLAMYYGQPWKARRRRAFYAQFLGEGDLAFDVGSHVGNRVASWLALGARVVAVEPQPDFVAILRGLYGRHPRVVIEPIGLSDAPGTLALHISRAAPTVSTLSDRFIADTRAAPRWSDVRWDDQIDVEVRTLDQLIAAHGEPRFLKIDVEGHEERVLRGLGHAVQALSFEYLPEMVEQAEACIARLEELGAYQYRSSAVETMRWSQGQWLGPDAMIGWLQTLRPTSGSGDVYARRA